MPHRRCVMGRFLKIAHVPQKENNAAASGQGAQGDNNQGTAAVCSGLKWYVSNRCQGKWRKTNKQRRKISIVCCYLFSSEQLKINGFAKRAARLTGFLRTYIKAGMKKYEQNRAHARRASESNEVTQERSGHQGCRYWIYDWFQNQCPLVELNKDHPHETQGR